MAGSSIEIRFDDQRVLAALERLEAAAVGAEPLLRALGAAMVDQTLRRFLGQHGPDGTPWKGLNPAYASIRRPGPILVQSGALRGSITFRTGVGSVRVGSGMIYAGVHQFGAVITPKVKKALRFRLAQGLVAVKSVTIPARPYLGLSGADEGELIEVAEAAMRALIGG
ncbi:MAG: phage virion morphogenesis protein [Rhodospirillales bacterium]|nr:phage virion morphogenesis protein [Rhodospirillales bacterium]